MSECPKTTSGWAGLVVGYYVGLAAGAIHGAVKALQGEEFNKHFEPLFEQCMERGSQIGDDNHETIKTVAITAVSRTIGYVVSDAIIDGIHHKHDS